MSMLERLHRLDDEVLGPPRNAFDVREPWWLLLVPALGLGPWLAVEEVGFSSAASIAGSVAIIVASASLVALAWRWDRRHRLPTRPSAG